MIVTNKDKGRRVVMIHCNITSHNPDSKCWVNTGIKGTIIGMPRDGIVAVKWDHGGNCNLWYESDTWQFVVDKSIVDILNS